MDRKLWSVAGVLLSLLLIFVILVSALQLVVNDTDFLSAQYTQLDQARSMGMSTEDLVRSTERMIEYMEGLVPDIDVLVHVDGEAVSMFNDRERAHMQDVRALYQFWRTVRDVALCLFGAFIILLWVKRRPRDAFYKHFLYASAIFAAIMAALLIWVAIDFSSFWVAFHHLFFNNDLWILDPATSRMINMMPQQLFFAIVMRIACWFLAVWGALMAVCGIGLYRMHKKKARV